MSTNVKITYINRSMNLDKPSVFLFTKNEVSTFDLLEDGVAWRVVEWIGRGSTCTFDFPVETEVSATWDNGSCRTVALPASIGEKFCVTQDNTGIILERNGNADSITAIDVLNNIHTPGGISVNLYKDNHVIMSKKIVGYDQKATFILHPKLYWGLASEIQEGEQLKSAVINSNSFFELDLEGMTEVTVGLYGNAEEGYQFQIVDWK